MDQEENGSNNSMTQKEQACASSELSQETKELCKEIGRLLARIGDRTNARMYLTRNGHNLRLNCRGEKDSAKMIRDHDPV